MATVPFAIPFVELIVISPSFLAFEIFSKTSMALLPIPLTNFPFWIFFDSLLLLQSVLKEQKKIQQQQEKRLTKISKKGGILAKLPKEKEARKNSKFKEKYRDRVESIQKTAENRRIAEEIEKMEKAKKNTQTSGRRSMYERENSRREQPPRRNQGKRSM